MVPEDNAADGKTSAGRPSGARKTAQKSAGNGGVLGAAPAATPSSNHGVKVPYEVIGAGSLTPRPDAEKRHGGRLGAVLDLAVKEPEPGVGLAASVDWISCTMPEVEGWRDVVDRAIRGVCDVREPMIENARGWMGYEKSAKIGPVAVAWGGQAQRQTVYLSIPGAVTGSMNHRRLSELVDILRDFGARLTRLDCAVDDYDGAFLSIERARGWYADGLFVTNGRPPKAKFISDEGGGSGSTFYVGTRAAGKLLRVYEKGKQLGMAASKWVRAEVQLGNKYRELPWHAVLQPANVVAGAYPALAPVGPAPLAVAGYYVKLSRSIDQAVSIAKTQCGAVVNLLAMVEGSADKDNAQRIIDRLIRHGRLPKRIDYSALRWKMDRDYEQTVFSGGSDFLRRHESGPPGQ